MPFDFPVYRAPDFAALGLSDAPDARLAAVEIDGVAPENYHATTMFPEYFRIGGVWRLAEESRMDCLAVWRDGAIAVVEFRLLKRGDLVVLGRSEDGSEGIYVHTDGFGIPGEHGEAFAFRQRRSRETAYSVDYDSLYAQLDYEHDHGNILWVMGPACAFDADARAAFARLVRAGYVHGLMAGNALATHDLEASYRGTARRRAAAGGLCRRLRRPGRHARPDPQGDDGDLHGLGPAHHRHGQHDPLLPGGGRRRAAGILLLGGHLRVRPGQAERPRQPDRADDRHKRSGLYRERQPGREQINYYRKAIRRCLVAGQRLSFFISSPPAGRQSRRR